MRYTKFPPAVVALAFGTTLLAVPAQGQEPDRLPVDSWISLEGVVKDVSPDRFTLDYGAGRIIVEMDDGDRDADAYVLTAGDSVTVAGRIDNDFFQATTLEASSVYVKNLGTTFFASAIDDDDRVLFPPDVASVDGLAVVVYGTVSEVRDDQFVLSSGPTAVTVEIGNMSYDPLDDDGYLRIEEGDQVRVEGKLEYDLMEGREILATTVTKVMN
jgi:uncharacterized protein YdeI (BOF family)